MKRSLYFDYVEEKLHVLARRIETRGKLNILDLHIHSENFYLYFFNLLYRYDLENLNKKLQNVEAIDLIDHKNKIIIQVSATCTKQKIESGLSKKLIKTYSKYTFKFISISKDASDLRKMIFLNPYSIAFIPSKDIYDISSILEDLISEDISMQKNVYNLILKELGGEIDIVKLDTNLATIINILAKEPWDEVNKIESINLFEIDRKINHNELKKAKDIIEEYSLYYQKVNSKYSEFDGLGSNKSNSVLATIKREYIKLKDEKDADKIFFSVIELIKDKVLKSANFQQIPIDELDLCIDILVVDAFIRCKIFKNLENYNYATT